MAERDNEGSYYLSRLKNLRHAVRSNDSLPFPHLASRVTRIEQQGIIFIVVELGIDALLEPPVLQALKSKAIFSLREDLKRIGKIQTADTIIAKG